MVNRTALRVALLRKGLVQWQLARKLGYEPSTFSDYVRGARRPPKDFEVGVARALDLPAEALRSQKA